MLAPLATTSDLTARGITVPSGMDADEILASATDAVRDAAGCPISETTSTVTLPVWERTCEVPLPGIPVTTVTSVTLNGASVAASVFDTPTQLWSDGWRLLDNTLVLTGVDLRPLPTSLVVTYTHGLPVVPRDIIDLVCSITAMAFDANGAYGANGRLGAVKLGDFAETFVHPEGTESPSPVAVPDRTRQALRARFGTNWAAVYMKAS